MTKQLLVSLHDVTPKYAGELSEIVAELDRIGIKKRSVLVVPNWEGEYDLRQDDGFVSWLHELKASGDELVLHGYDHRAEKRGGHYRRTSITSLFHQILLRSTLKNSASSRFFKVLYENPFQWFMGEMFAQGTGEFQNLNYQEARQKLQKGKAILSDAELGEVVGFVAPAWLTNGKVERALKDEGFQYHVFTTFMKYCGELSKISIRNVQTGETLATREVAFEGSRALIDYGTRGLAWLVTRNTWTQVMRIAIHPQDVHRTRPFDFALELIKEAKEGRELATYKEICNKNSK